MDDVNNKENNSYIIHIKVFQSHDFICPFVYKKLEINIFDESFSRLIVRKCALKFSLSTFYFSVPIVLPRQHVVYSILDDSMKTIYQILNFMR
jgi:hypothetical protein